MKPSAPLKRRVLRVHIVLKDGRNIDQSVYVEADSEAEFERSATAFAQGVLAASTIHMEDDIVTLKIAWQHRWNQPTVSYPLVLS